MHPKSHYIIVLISYCVLCSKIVSFFTLPSEIWPPLQIPQKGQKELLSSELVLRRTIRQITWKGGSLATRKV